VKLRAVGVVVGAPTIAAAAARFPRKAILVGLGIAFTVSPSAQGLAPAIQTRLMDVAGDSQTLAAAINHSALNIGNSLGALLGGMTIAAGFGYLSPTWLGLILVVPGVLFALVGWSITRRATARLVEVA